MHTAQYTTTVVLVEGYMFEKGGSGWTLSLMKRSFEQITHYLFYTLSCMVNQEFYLCEFIRGFGLLPVLI